MPLRLSRSAQYAIQVLVHLSRHDTDEAVPTQTIAEAEGIPLPFVAKVVRRMVPQGFVSTTRGPKGGLRLARDASAITVLDVIACVDGEDPTAACVLLPRECDANNPCMLHETWTDIGATARHALAATTVADLAG